MVSYLNLAVQPLVERSASASKVFRYADLWSRVCLANVLSYVNRGSMSCGGR